MTVKAGRQSGPLERVVCTGLNPVALAPQYLGPLNYVADLPGRRPLLYVLLAPTVWQCRRLS